MWSTPANFWSTVVPEDFEPAEQSPATLKKCREHALFSGQGLLTGDASLAAAQYKFLNFARCGLGQFLHHAHPFWSFEVSKAVSHMQFEIIF